MSDSRERVDYAGLARFKEDLLDVVYAHINNSISKEEIIGDVYPVGSIYMSINSTSPATLFGGTWSQIKDTFLLAAGDTYESGETGGEAVHTLSVNEMPSHSHSMTSHTHSIPELSGTAANAGSHSHTVNDHSHSIASFSVSTGTAGSHSHTVNDHSHSIASFSVNTNSIAAHEHSVHTSTYYLNQDTSISGTREHLVHSSGSTDYSGVMASAGGHSHSISIGSRYTATASATTASVAAHSHSASIGSRYTEGASATTASVAAHSHSITTTSSTTGSTTTAMSTTGSGESHNNMPPYLAVYVWQRIA